MDDLTEIAVILDRSGSMASIKDDMSGGLWSLVVEQHGLPGRCQISLYQFDTEFQVVFEGKPSGSVTREDCLLVPRGGTALNDAVVKGLSAIEAKILQAPENQRPGKVVVAVITDGQENSSRENTADDARKAIERATEKLGWRFVYLAADPAGFAEGMKLSGGLRCASVGQYVVQDAAEAFGRYSRGIANYRTGASNFVDVSKKDGETE